MTSSVNFPSFGARKLQPPYAAFNPQRRFPDNPPVLQQPFFGGKDRVDKSSADEPTRDLLSEDARYKLWQMKVRLRRKYHRIMQAIKDFLDGDGGGSGGGGGGGGRFFDENGRELIPLRVPADRGRRNYFA